MATKRLTLIIDLSPEMFHEELRIHDSDPLVIEATSDTTALTNADNLRVRLAEAMESITLVNSRLNELAEERDRLLEMKEMSLRQANHIIDILCEDYEQRKVLRYLVNEEDFSRRTMSSKLNMRESEIEEVFRKLEARGLLTMSR